MLPNLLQLRRAIHLTHNATPHKFIFVYLETRNRVAQSLAKRICKELREAYLNAQETPQLIESPISQTVIITERTMFDGIVGLKHTKPRITEEVHVSDLKDRLLQMS